MTVAVKEWRLSFLAPTKKESASGTLANTITSGGAYRGTIKELGMPVVDVDASGGFFNLVDADFHAYLRSEAERRGVSYLTVLEEEEAARRELQRNPLTHREIAPLLRPADSPHPYLDYDDDECPF
ncbi:MAG: hypothetical protein HYS13_24805 [Planctomycetia bacterium]|nr:hypothetical protein [Planctomycetia bacterium]